MQTFLPYPDFARSARVLDRKRLGKQRVETLQVLPQSSNLTARVFGDLFEADGTPSPLCPRTFLRKCVAQATELDQGYSVDNDLPAMNGSLAYTGQDLDNTDQECALPMQSNARHGYPE